MEFLRRWGAREDAGRRGSARRWVVIDTETTGLDPQTDALLAIGGVAVDDAGIRATDSFEVVVRHNGEIAASNIIVHGLGRETIGAGVAPAVALDALRHWTNGAPCFAFHAEFDRRVLDRAAMLAGVSRLAGPWMDLAPLAALLYPDVPRTGGGALDDWLSALRIACASRHNAASDALASAELLLALRSMAATQGARRFDELEALTKHRRWLGDRRSF